MSPAAGELTMSWKLQISERIHKILETDEMGVKCRNSVETFHIKDPQKWQCNNEIYLRNDSVTLRYISEMTV